MSAKATFDTLSGFGRRVAAIFHSDLLALPETVFVHVVTCLPRSAQAPNY